MNPSQARAARAMLRWSLVRASEMSGVTARIIRKFELGSEVPDKDKKYLEGVYTRHGVEFKPDDLGMVGLE